MSTQVHRLQALLERVQENRNSPRAVSKMAAPAAKPQPVRAAAPTAPSASPQRPAAAPQAIDRRAEPRPADRAKAGATPLEMAFEDQLSGAHAPPQAAPARREPAPAPRAEQAGPFMRADASSGGTAPAPRGGASSDGTAPALRGGASSDGTAPALRGGASSSPREGAMLVDPQAMQPSKPIVQVVSKHPPSVSATFGELLRRSLSLRPR